jgi:hypothetical protein
MTLSRLPDTTTSKLSTMLGAHKKPAARFASAGWISYKNF